MSVLISAGVCRVSASVPCQSQVSRVPCQYKCGVSVTSVTSVASECKRAQSAISPAMSRVLACCAVSRISCHHTHKQTQATATLQHVPALHATTNTRLPSHTSTHTHAQQWTSLRGSRPSLSRPNGGLSRVSGVSAVWLRGPGPLKQRQGGREAGRELQD